MGENLQQPLKLDIIFLSYAKDESLKKLTLQAVDTLLSSEDPAAVQFDITIIESNRAMAPYQYPHSVTIYPDEVFGFHKFLNMGIRMTRNPWFVLCNNDLVFHPGWASAILHAMENDPEISVASPHDEISHTANGVKNEGQNVYSNAPGILIGWCIFFRREVIDKIGLLDEKIEFWYSDNDVGKSLTRYGLKHALVTSSRVTHLGSQSINTFTPDVFFNITYGSFLYFDYKWNHRNRFAYAVKKAVLPVFRAAMLNRKKSLFNDYAARLLAKLYGGLKT